MRRESEGRQFRGWLSKSNDICRWNKPAIANVWPLATSTVVSARRTIRLGRSTPLALTAPTRDSELTSGFTRRADSICSYQGRRELERDPERLVRDGDLPCLVSGNWNWNLASCQEARGPPA